MPRSPRRAGVLGLAACALLAGCGGEDRSDTKTTLTFVPKEGSDAGPPRALNPQPQAGPPRELFANNCASCHVLEDAEGEGFIGPNLDEMRPSAARVQAAIENGGAEQKIMPSDLLVEEDARRVARYVARVAGR